MSFLLRKLFLHVCKRDVAKMFSVGYYNSVIVYIINTFPYFYLTLVNLALLMIIVFTSLHDG